MPACGVHLLQLRRVLSSIERFQASPQRQSTPVAFSPPAFVHSLLFILALSWASRASRGGRRGPSAVVGPIEEDDEYKLIVEANNLTAEIDNEISTGVLAFLRGSPRLWPTAAWPCPCRCDSYLCPGQLCQAFSGARAARAGPHRLCPHSAGKYAGGGRRWYTDGGPTPPACDAGSSSTTTWTWASRP
jgi:hypothetical protein